MITSLSIPGGRWINDEVLDITQPNGCIRRVPVSRWRSFDLAVSNRRTRSRSQLTLEFRLPTLFHQGQMHTQPVPPRDSLGARGHPGGNAETTRSATRCDAHPVTAVERPLSRGVHTIIRYLEALDGSYAFSTMRTLLFESPGPRGGVENLAGVFTGSDLSRWGNDRVRQRRQRVVA